MRSHVVPLVNYKSIMWLGNFYSILDVSKKVTSIKTGMAYDLNFSMSLVQFRPGECKYNTKIIKCKSSRILNPLYDNYFSLARLVYGWPFSTQCKVLGQGLACR